MAAAAQPLAAHESMLLTFDITPGVAPVATVSADRTAGPSQLAPGPDEPAAAKAAVPAGSPELALHRPIDPSSLAG